MKNFLQWKELLPELKGAPLSIVMVLSLTGNRSISVTELAEATGYSEKPIRSGLGTLHSMGLVTEPKRNRYQLTGNEYQLPLSWEEKVLPSGVSPEITGVSPVSGISPELTRRVEALETAVFGHPAAVNSPESGDNALLICSEDEDEAILIPEKREEYSGNVSGKLGIYPYPGEKAKRKVCTIDLKAGESKDITGDSPEKQGDNPEGLINNINNHHEEKEVSKYVEKLTYLPKSDRAEVINPAAENRWKAAMTQMKGQMSKGQFATMLGHSELIGYEDGLYTVAVQNSFVRDWAEDRLAGTIEKFLSMMGEGPQRVSFVLQNAECGMQSQEPAEERPAVQTRSMLEVTGTGKHEAENVRICNAYLTEGDDRYSLEELSELVEMDPDPEILRFALPRMSCLQSVKAWCGWDIVKAKSMLLKKYEIIRDANKRIAENPDVSLELIERHCEECCPDNRGLAIDRILRTAEYGEVPA